MDTQRGRMRYARVQLYVTSVHNGIKRCIRVLTCIHYMRTTATHLSRIDVYRDVVHTSNQNNPLRYMHAKLLPGNIHYAYTCYTVPVIVCYLTTVSTYHWKGVKLTMCDYSTIPRCV